MNKPHKSKIGPDGIHCYDGACWCWGGDDSTTTIGARTSKPLVWDGKWEEVLNCIHEIEWFATRKRNLAEPVLGRDYDWASMLQSDINDLMRAIDAARRPADETSDERCPKCGGITIHDAIGSYHRCPENGNAQ